MHKPDLNSLLNRFKLREHIKVYNKQTKKY